MKNKSFKIVAFSSIALSSILGLSSCVEPQVSDWRHVAVSSRTTILIPYSAFATETEVSLRFSDGSSWRGAPSYAKSNEEFLLYSQVGDSVWYRYNSSYFTGKEWSR